MTSNVCFYANIHFSLKRFNFKNRQLYKCLIKKPRLAWSNANTNYVLKVLQFNKAKKPKGCGGGSDVCRFLAAYGTATKAGQLLRKAEKDKSP